MTGRETEAKTTFYYISNPEYSMREISRGYYDAGAFATTIGNLALITEDSYSRGCETLESSKWIF